jgi:hypothetical protein
MAPPQKTLPNPTDPYGVYRQRAVQLKSQGIQCGGCHLYEGTNIALEGSSEVRHFQVEVPEFRVIFEEEGPGGRILLRP